MAIEATGSKFSRNNNLITFFFCLAVALYFGYDGWFGSYRDEQLKENDGKPTVDLLVNMYAPIPLGAFALYSLIAALRIPSRKIIAGQQGLEFSSGKHIDYDSIQQIDKRHFEKKGVFTIDYEDQDKMSREKFSYRSYDNLALLLDEIIRRTGAEPENTTENNNS